jgi:hypothetical protein
MASEGETHTPERIEQTNPALELIEAERGAGATLAGNARERRQWPRFSSEHMIAYTHMDPEAQASGMGMAKTLDLSEGGVKLQVHGPFPDSGRFHMFMAVDEMLVEAIGRIVHQRELGQGQYEMGASFLHLEEKGRRLLASSDLGTNDWSAVARIQEARRP